MSDLIQRLNAGIDVTNRRLLTLRTQQDIELALVFREILTETRDEIERLGRELTEARDGIKEVMTDHAATLERLDAALSLLREIEPLVFEGDGAYSTNDLQHLTRRIRGITTPDSGDGGKHG